MVGQLRAEDNEQDEDQGQGRGEHGGEGGPGPWWEEKGAGGVIL